MSKIEKLKKFIIENDIDIEDAAQAFGFGNILFQAVKIEQLIVQYTLKLRSKDLIHNEKCVIGQALRNIKALKEL